MMQFRNCQAHQLVFEAHGLVFGCFPHTDRRSVGYDPRRPARRRRRVGVNEGAAVVVVDAGNEMGLGGVPEATHSRGFAATR